MIRRSAAGLALETVALLIAGTLAAALLLATGGELPGDLLLVVLALLVVLTGLPHGALDPWIARRAGLWRSATGCAAFHLAYLALALAVILVWQAAPVASLALFLALSAWHFAGDWQADLAGWRRALAGSSLLTLPAMAFPQEVAEAFVVLAGAPGAQLATALQLIAPWLALGLLAGVLSAPRCSLATRIELAALAALSQLLPPLVYFIVYFCALHSLRHLRSAAQMALPAQRARMAAVALSYSALTVLLVALAWPFLDSVGGQVAGWQERLQRWVFIGLAALTVPHMLVLMRAERAAGTPS